MAESFAFANRGTITVVGTPTGPASTPLGVVKDVDISWAAEHVPLYGWGSTLRQAVAKHSVKVSVKVGWMKFDPTVTTWLPMFILSAGTTATGSVVDTNVVKLFQITARFTMEDGTYLKGIIDNVFFPDFPIKAAEGQWVKVDLNGEGTTITWSNSA